MVAHPPSLSPSNHSSGWLTMNELQYHHKCDYGQNRKIRDKCFHIMESQYHPDENPCNQSHIKFHFRHPPFNSKNPKNRKRKAHELNLNAQNQSKKKNNMALPKYYRCFDFGYSLQAASFALYINKQIYRLS